MIRYNCENVQSPKFYRKQTSEWIRSVAYAYGKKIGEINFIFCDNDKILELNKNFLSHDYYTDVITFDYCHEDIISGDIFISLDTVKENSEEYNVSFEIELKRVMIHGILHLCGQKDKTEEDALNMRKKEDIALKLM